MVAERNARPPTFIILITSFPMENQVKKKFPARKRQFIGFSGETHMEAMIRSQAMLECNQTNFNKCQSYFILGFRRRLAEREATYSSFGVVGIFLCQAYCEPFQNRLTETVLMRGHNICFR